MTGGADAAAGRGMQYSFAVSGTWVSGETYSITLTDQLTAVQTQIGAGYVSGIVPLFAMTFQNKIYALAGSSVYFCAEAAATTWNDPNGIGNGFINLGNQFGVAEPLEAVGVYQGRLAIASRRSVQIWTMDPDPSQNAQGQVLSNIGTFAKLSLQAIGDQDIYMLYDSGFRAIRVRDASNNAIIDDVGVPVDSIVQSALAGLPAATAAKACAIVDPAANRYWCYIPGQGGAVGSIYVLSSFPRSQIEAWSQYTPNYSAGEGQTVTTFTPTDIVNEPGGTPYVPWLNLSISQVKYTGLIIGETYTYIKGEYDQGLYCGGEYYYSSCTFVAQDTVAIGGGAYDGSLLTVSAQLYGLSGYVTTTYSTTTFAPDKFVVYNGQVYVRSGDNIFLFGGQTAVQYDACGLHGTTPFFDAGDPTASKSWYALDAAIEGTWAIGAITDYIGGALVNLYNGTVPSFDNLRPTLNRSSTHIALDFVESGSAYARLSGMMVAFKPGPTR